MNRKLLGFGLSSAALCLAASTAPSYAGNFQDSGQLPDASQFYKAPRRYQITGPDAIVTDTRHPTVHSKLVIHVPPAPQDVTNEVQIGGDGGGAEAGAGGPIPISRSDLPDATGGGSNIPAGGVRPKTALPQGTTTNRLGNVYGNRVPKNANTQHPMLAQQHTATKKPTAVSTYGEQPFSTGSASGEGGVITKTIGTLLRK